MKTPEEVIDEAWANFDAVCGHDLVQALNAEGYAVVPKEPTEDMYQAAEMEVGILQIYSAMLSAAPNAKKAAQPGD